VAELWIASNLPPPVHGVAVFNEALVEGLRRRGIKCRFIRVGSEVPGDIGRLSLGKVYRDCKALSGLIAKGGSKRRKAGQKRILYFTLSQWGPATIRDLAVSTIGKCLFDRVVGHIHGCGWLEHERRRGVFPYAMRFALRSCDAVICLGETFASAMRSRTGCDCIGIDNGVVGASYPLPKALPRDGAPLKLLFLGNLIRSKGLWAAAEAAQTLRRAQLPVVLQCAGEWRRQADAREFERQFRTQLGDGTVVMVGPADSAKKERLLRETHFLLLPTRYPFEGQPLVLLEAMSAGVVPLTTDQGGIPDLMRFPGGARLVSGDFEYGHALAAAVRAIQSASGEYELLSRACLQRFQDHLTFDRCLNQILAVLGDGDLTESSWMAGADDAGESYQKLQDDPATAEQIWECEEVDSMWRLGS